MKLILISIVALAAPLKNTIAASWIVRGVGLLLLFVGVVRILYPPELKDLFDAQYDHE